MKKILFILVAALMVGCKCPECVTTTEVEKTIEVRTRDTILVTEADSASIRALFRCDSAFNVILGELVTMQGDRIDAELYIEKLEAGAVRLRLNCKEDSLEQVIQLQDSVIKSFETQTIIVTEKYIPAYYKNCTRGFWVLFAILILVAGGVAFKIYMKFQSGGLF